MVSLILSIIILIFAMLVTIFSDAYEKCFYFTSGLLASVGFAFGWNFNEFTFGYFLAG